MMMLLHGSVLILGICLRELFHDLDLLLLHVLVLLSEVPWVLVHVGVYLVAHMTQAFTGPCF